MSSTPVSQFAILFLSASLRSRSLLASPARTHHGLLHARRLRLGDDGDVLLVSPRRRTPQHHPRRRRRVGRRRDKDGRGHLQPRHGQVLVFSSLSLSLSLSLSCIVAHDAMTELRCLGCDKKQRDGEVAQFEDKEGDKCGRAPSPFFFSFLIKLTLSRSSLSLSL